MEVEGEVECDNKFRCIDFNANNIVKYEPALEYNSSRFDMIFLINILHDPPNHHVENIIGNLIYFKNIIVKTADEICLKFLDTKNCAGPQTLESFRKTFCDKKNF
jgi:hypothetical protein